MAANSKGLLLDQLSESGLLQQAQLEELARLPEAQDLDPRVLGKVVCQRGWLTRYQVSQVALGRAKDLHIGPYLLLDRLGEGGMGQVFKAQHQHLGRTVALKLVRKERLRSPNAVKRFYQEFQAAGQLHHPNIVMAFDAGEADGTHFLSMEYVPGQDLAGMVRDLGPLPVAQACDYIRQAAVGLQHAHERGLVHRDIKPSNLLVATPPTGESLAGGKGPAWGTVKILDMGLARIQQGLSEQEQHLTRDGAILGTPDFLAPEQALEARKADNRSDLYSLGCTLYYLLSGRTPFHAESLTQLLLKHQMEEPPPLESLRPEVPAGVLQIIRQLLAKRPEDRIQSGADLAAALEPFCSADGVAPREPVRRSIVEREATWATIAAADDRPAPVRVKTMPGDRTMPAEDVETLTRARKEPRRKVRKPQQEEPAANRLGLILALAGAGILIPVLGVVGIGAMLWFRSHPGKPPVIPPGPPTQVAEGSKSSERTTIRPGPIIPGPPQGGNVSVQPGTPSAAAAEELRRLEPVETPVSNLVFSPDGRKLAGADGIMAYIWDVASGRLLQRLGGAPSYAQTVAFAPDSRHVVLGGRGHILQLWDAEDGKSLRDFPGHTTMIHAVAVSPDGRRVFSAAGGQVIENGSPVIKDGRALYEDCAVIGWDPQTGKELCRFSGHTDPVFQLTLSVDGRRALSRSPSRLCVWDPATGQEIRSLGVASSSAVLSPDGRQVLVARGGLGLLLWDVDQNREVRGFQGLAAQVDAIALSGGGALAVSGSHLFDPNATVKIHDCTVWAWDVRTGRQLHRFDGHTSLIASVAVSADGRLAASSAHDHTVRLWDLSKVGTDAPRPPAGSSERPATPKEVKPAPPVPVTKKIAAPTAKELETEVAGIRKRESKDYSRKPSDRGPLAMSLLRKAAETSDNPNGRFALLHEAADVATHAAEAALALQAIDQLDKTYEVDALDLKVKALTEAGKAATSPAAHRAVAESALPVLDQLVAADAYDKAQALVSVTEAEAQSAKQSAFLNQVKAWCKEVNEAKKDYDATQAARARLQEKPDDPDASLTVGRYLCFRKGEWDRGLPLLTRGTEKSLQDLAKRDLARPNSAADQRSLGDAWWDVADTNLALGKAQLRRHACAWYRQALAGLTGLTRDKVAERIQEVQEETDLKSSAGTTELRRCEGHMARVTCVAFLPDSRHIVTGSYDKTARLWSVQTGKEVRRFNPAAGAEITCLSISPDGSLALLGALNPKVETWKVEDGAGLVHSHVPGTRVASLAYAPDANRVLFGNLGGGVVLWTSPNTSVDFKVNTWGTPHSIATAKEGRFALLGCDDGLAHLVDLDLKKEMLPGLPRGHNGMAILGVALSRDARLAVTGGADRTACLWETGTRKLLHRFIGHLGAVRSVALSADGRYVLTGSDDFTVRLWDAQSGAELRRFTGHTDAVTSVAFSLDGRLAASASDDRTARMWELSKAQPAP
jgi:serine/threonine-protein kinase